MNILIDTNIALDILLNRQPHYINAAQIYGMTDNNVIKCFISASAITDIFYLSSKDLGKIPAKESLKQMLHVFRPATVTGSQIYQALDMDWEDFEDSVQYVVGENLPVDYIITRDTKDYSSGSIPALTPAQFLELFSKDD